MTADSEKRITRACGALGCTETEDLQEVTVDGVTRMLCPDCIPQFKRQYA